MNARLALFASAALLGGCAAIAGIGDIELSDPPPPSTSTSATEPALPEEDAPSPVADDAAAPAPPDADAPPDASVDAPLEAAADATVDAPIVDDPDDVGPMKCTPADFQANDRRAAAAARTIIFPVAGGYDPHCMMVRAGQSVTFQGDLAAHPLAPRGTSPAPSPITLTKTGMAVTFTFPVRGRYRYGSPGSPAMRGVIDVRP